MKYQNRTQTTPIITMADDWCVRRGPSAPQSDERGVASRSRRKSNRALSELGWPYACRAWWIRAVLQEIALFAMTHRTVRSSCIDFRSRGYPMAHTHDLLLLDIFQSHPTLHLGRFRDYGQLSVTQCKTRFPGQLKERRRRSSFQ